SFAAVTGTNLIRIRRNCNGNGCNISGYNQYSWTVVADPGTPTATKSPNIASVCTGQTLTLVSPVNGGGGTGTCNFQYRYSTNNGSSWSVWSNTVASFAAVATTNNLIQIRRNCSGSGCNISGSTQYSWSVVADPTFSNQANDDNATICAGGTNNFSVGVSGGISLTYQWQYFNGSWGNVANGSPTGAVYTNQTTNTVTVNSSTATGAHLFRCVVSDAGTGCTATITSNNGTLTVVSDPSAPTATKSPASATVCVGATLTLVSPTSGGGGTGVCNFEYRYSTNNGSSWTGWSTSVSSFAAVAGTNLIQIRYNCNGSGCNISSSTQYSWAVVVDPSAPTATKSPNVASVCAGQTLTLVSPTSGGGGTGTCNFEYRHSTNNGSSWTGWSTIVSSFAAVATTNNLIQIRYNCNGSGCNISSSTQYSWSVVADPAFTNQASDDNATICSGGTNNFSVAVSGGISVTYQWQFFNGSWGNVTNGTPAGAVYSNQTTNTVTVTSTTATGAHLYRCSVSDGGTGCTSPITSNTGTLTVVADPSAPTATKSPASATVCAGATLTLASPTSGGGGTGSCNFEYRHSTNNGSTWTGWSTSISSFAAVTGTNLIQIRYNCNGSGCNISSSTQYSWTVVADPSAPTATKSPTDATVCAGATLTLVSPTSGGGGTGTCNFEYRHSTNNGSSWTGWSTIVSSFAAVTGTNLVQIRYNCNGSGCNISTSTQYSWTVVPDPTFSNQANDDDATICAGGSNSFSVTVSDGLTLTYQWQFLNGSWGNVGNGTPSGATYGGQTTNNVTVSGVSVAGAHLYRCVVSDAGTGCTATIISNTGTLTVVADPSAPTATKSPTSTTVCAGATLTLASPTSGGGGTGACNFEYRYSTNNGSSWTGWSTTVASFAAVAGTNLVEIRYNCSGSGCNISSSTQYSWTVVADPSAPTASKLPNAASVCLGATLTVVSPTAGGGGTGTCNFEYRHSTNNGSSWTGWSTIVSNFASVIGTNLVEIRYNCDGSGCNIS
ncbi:MAG: hypothetical protein JKX73_11585, partial [Flavobacteriales bacterium]|nr:hypothetical protein [Flavobacteriales bacterium]